MNKELMPIRLKKIWGQLQSGILDKNILPEDIKSIDSILKSQKIAVSEQFKAEEIYWANKFSDGVPETGIPSDFPKTDAGRCEVTRIKAKMGKVLSNRIKTAFLEHNHSMYALIISVLNILLWKYTGQDDLVVGLPVFGDPSGSPNGISGLFSNILPIRNQISEEMTFQQHFDIVEQSISEAYTNRHYPYEKLLKDIKLCRQINAASLFSVMVAPGHMEGQIVKTDGIQVQGHFLHGGAQADLVIYAGGNTTHEDMEITVEYSPLLYKKVTVERILRHFYNIIDTIAQKPGTKLHEINLMDESELERILFRFNNPATPCDYSQLIHSVFEKKAQSVPDNIAVVSWDACLTYGELNEEADSLACTLKKTGVTRETIVGILMENSANMIISILAVLKAGGAYLPIDKKCPRDRINYMLEDSGAKLLLVDGEMCEKQSSGWKTMVVSKDTVNNRTIKKPNEKTDISIGSYEKANNFNSSGEKTGNNVSASNDMAYIIYTSGTTGNPKGVIVEHRNVIAYVNAFQNEFHIGQEAIVLQQASCSFDLFVEEVYPALLNGGRIVIPKRSDILDMDCLCRIIKNNKVNIISCSPLMLNELSKYSDISTVNLFISGGDVLKPEYISKLLERARVYNTYGPTETTVCVTYYNCGSGTEGRSIPIGRPILNYKVYILDSRNNPVPVGVPGELCISGDGVTRGYLNRERLTGEKFIPSPFEPGETIYKTGDLARWLDDGNIEFMGRIDRQVKIRGYRIELSEIERKITGFGGIQAAVVTSNTDKTGSQYLCAYVLANGDEANEELREYLKKQLPEYMVPAIIVNLDKFPLTQNGKMDQKALLRLAEAVRTNVEYQAPIGDKEEKLSLVWREVLGIEKVGRSNNFFDLGGNSIKAIQIVTRLKDEFSISVNHIFEYQNISQLAQNINYMPNSCDKGETASQKSNPCCQDGTDRQENKLVQYRKRNAEYDKLDLTDVLTYGNILLTGSTGYLGIYLLKDLLEYTSADIYLLVRGDSALEAETRVINKLEFYFSKSIYAANMDRIHIINGDITKEGFNLEPWVYESLSNKIDCIINSAANVKYFGRYRDIYDINVNGVRKLAGFALTGKVKDFNHISTISTASGEIKGSENVVYTEYDSDIGQIIDNYYARSKLDAEKVLLDYRSKGLKINIFRLGSLVFDSYSGKFQDNIGENTFYLLLKSSLKLGVMPALKGTMLDFSYIDFVSKAITLLFNRSQLINETYHIFNSKQIDMYGYSRVLEAVGYKTEVMADEDYIEFLQSQSNNEEIKDYISNMLLAISDFKQGNTNFTICQDKTLKILARLDFHWDEINKGLIRKMINYCIKASFL